MQLATEKRKPGPKPGPPSDRVAFRFDSALYGAFRAYCRSLSPEVTATAQLESLMRKFLEEKKVKIGK